MGLSQLFSNYSKQISSELKRLNSQVDNLSPVNYTGRIKSATGAIVNAVFPQVKIGDLCLIRDSASGLRLHAEAVSIDDLEVKLLPYGSIENISSLATVKKLSTNFTIKVGSFLLGKVINGLGEVQGSMLENDHNGADAEVHHYPIMSLAPDPLARKMIEEPLDTGVKAIDLFIRCGKGQRLAIFAGPGMGKTTLIGMIIKYAKADVIVVALIGERGREVREFIEIELPEEARHKCVMVVVTSDRPPVEQVKAAYTAQTIAEYFRDQGLDVVLFVDSITRFARAQREVGLSAGEPITRGGFPPSVFLAFPRLMERAGNNQYGSITAFYTVLMEGEQTNQDPIADEIKSIVDGHIVLSRKLVESGHFPAINVLASLSRVADRIISEKHKLAARRARMLLAKYEELEFLVRVGEYQRGNDKLADETIDKYPLIMKFLQQGIVQECDFERELAELLRLSAN